MSTAKPKVLMLHSENSGVGYYRIWMQAKYLQRMGWEVVRFPDAIDKISMDEWVERIQGVDIVIAQRSDNPDVVALLMAIRDEANCPIVFETDDNVYDVAANSPAYQFFYPGSPLIQVSDIAMQNVDAITTSTQALADVYAKNNKNIFVLKNAQDPEEWEGIERPGGNDKIVIGWAGSSTHYDDLRLVRQPIKKLLRNHPNVILRVFGMNPDFFGDHDQIEIVTGWANVYEWHNKLAELNFDIGIAPVVHRPFNLGKSNIKWQEYSMLGIPTVASNLGEYKEIIHGETGFLANSDVEWHYHLEQLVKDSELRKKIGEQAKRYTLENNMITENIGKYDDTYKRIISDYQQSVSR